jgi:TolB-like protein/class 3 adenylate cyclase
MPEDRRLAAIMFTDIVGYTALMGSDEDKAFQILRKNRNIQKPIIKKFNGKWLKEMGDGILASFNNASDAVRCAGEIQQAVKKEGIGLRIGIHEGEVVFEGGDVLGDGVNIASRLEELAQEGCINISGAVYKDVRNKTGITSEFIEEVELKNVVEPVKVYKVKFEQPEIETKEKEGATPIKSKLNYFLIAGIFIIFLSILVWQLFSSPKSSPISDEIEYVEPDKSIAVLPFIDISPDKDQEYFCDAMLVEILMHLYKIGDLRVTARQSVMGYKGTDKKVKEIAHELGVAHILSGSVQKFEDQLRITVQLIDTIFEQHLWAESYDRQMKDVFTIQSDIIL